jgi:4-hydroxy-tetrahydrodipicolinate synthase
VAEDRIGDSVEFALEYGCHAIVAAGTGSQETASLTPAERTRLITATVEAVNGEVPVLGGVSHPALSVVSDLIEHVESEGADAVIAMPPWDDVPSDDAIIRYYEHITQETNLPVGHCLVEGV